MADLDVTVRLRDALSRPLSQSRAEINRLEQSVEDLSRELGSSSREARAAQAQLNALRRAAGLAERDFADLNREITENERRTARAARRQATLNRAFGQGSRDTQIFGKVLGSLKLPAIISALTLVVTAVGALGAAAVAGVAGLAPLVGLVGAIPALGVAAGQALAVTKLGFGGIGEALGVLGDATSTVEEQTAALEKLTPAGRDFVGILLDLKDGAKGFKDTVQGGLLPGVGEGLKAIMPLLPVVENGLHGTAHELGETARQAGLVAGAMGDDVASAMSRSDEIIAAARPGMTALLGIIMDLIIVGGPLALRFVEWLSRGAVELERMVQAGRESGGLESFLGRAGDLAADVWKVLTDISVALFNVGVESGGLGDVMGGGLLKAAADFRAWTESLEGKASIKQFFDDAVPVVSEMSRLVLELVKSIGGFADDKALAPVIKQLTDEVLPAIVALGEGVGTNLGPAVLDLVTAWLTFSNVLSFEPIISLATFVGDVVKSFTDWIAITPGASTGIATLLAAVLALKVGLALMRISGLGAVIMVIPTFVRAMRSGAIATTGMTTAQKVAAVTGRALRAVMIATGVAARFLGKGMWAALGPIGFIILAVMALIAAFIYFYNNNETFRAGVDRFVAVVVRLAKVLWEKLKVAWDNVVIAVKDAWRVTGEAIGWIAEKARWLGGRFAEAWANVVTAWNSAVALVNAGVAWVVAAFQTAWAAIKTAVGAVFDWLSAAWDWVTGKIKAGLNLLKAAWDFYFNLIRDKVRSIIDGMKEKLDWWFAVIKLGISGFLQFWRTKFDEVKAKVDAIIDPIKEKFTDLWDGAKEKFTAFIEKLKGITLPGWIQTLVDAIKAINDGIVGGVGKLAAFFQFGDAPAPRIEGGGGGGTNGSMTTGGGGGAGTNLTNGRAAQGYSGTALARVNQLGLSAGLRVTSTYRSPAKNRAVGGSPTSLHMDRANPAVDIAGPTGALDNMARRLRAVGGWRQLLWRVAGHYDHLHVAHAGGMVESSWASVPGLLPDERPAILQTGERVLNRAETSLYNGAEVTPWSASSQAHVSAPSAHGAEGVESSTGEGWPALHFHVGDGTDAVDVAREVKRVVRDMDRERKERR